MVVDCCFVDCAFFPSNPGMSSSYYFFSSLTLLICLYTCSWYKCKSDKNLLESIRWPVHTRWPPRSCCRGNEWLSVEQRGGFYMLSKCWRAATCRASGCDSVETCLWFYTGKGVVCSCAVFPVSRWTHRFNCLRKMLTFMFFLEPRMDTW